MMLPNQYHQGITVVTVVRNSDPQSIPSNLSSVWHRQRIYTNIYQFYLIFKIKI